jgi:signal transduction histidine kinase
MRLMLAHRTKAQAARFILISAIFSLVQVAILVLGWGALRVIDTTRAYATGESFYSKAANAAIFNLYKYADTGDEAIWASFRAALDVTLGDRQAREELVRHNPDERIATEGFLRGRNATADIPDAILVFRLFKTWRPFQAALDDWQNGDEIIDQLLKLGLQLHGLSQGAALTPSARGQIIGKIDQLERQLAQFESNFTAHIADAARAATRLVTAVLGGVSLVLWGFGVSLSWKTYHRGIAAESDLKESEERFRDFAIVASDWFWETDACLNVTYLSERFANATGISPRELLARAEGATRWMTSAPDEPGAVAVAGRQPIRGHVYCHIHEGQAQYWKISGVPIFDAEKEFRGYRGTGTNITEEIRASEALREAKEASDVANRAKSEFLANMSHELRTPLNAILGFSEITKGRLLGDAPEKYSEYAGNIFDSGKLLLSLIDDILDLAKIEAGRMELDEETIDVRETIDAAVGLMRQHISTAQLDLIVQVADDLPPLRADERKLKQMILNLLSNALKFTTAPGSISIGASRDLSGNLILMVSDTGIGIPADKLATVLQPFGQVQNSMTRAHSGTGLGLPMVKALAEQHGGTFALQSEPGRGTDVIITFPQHRFLIEASHPRDVAGSIPNQAANSSGRNSASTSSAA